MLAHNLHADLACRKHRRLPCSSPPLGSLPLWPTSKLSTRLQSKRNTNGVHSFLEFTPCKATMVNFLARVDLACRQRRRLPCSSPPLGGLPLWHTPKLSINLQRQSNANGVRSFIELTPCLAITARCLALWSKSLRRWSRHFAPTLT